MNFLLHGATDMGSSNYGDFLYAYIIYNFFRKRYSNSTITFYNPSNYFTKYLGLGVKTNINWKNYDYCVYIPGGYFGEGHNARYRDNIIHFIRFMIFGLKAVFYRKKIIVLAIGAGPINSKLFKIPIIKILNNSKIVTVRDHESYIALKDLNTDAKIIESFDLIITERLNFKNNTKKIDNIVKGCKNKKILLVHYNHSLIALKKFSEAVKLFIDENPEYSVIVTSDCILKNEEEYFMKFKSNLNKSVNLFKFESPFELTELIEKVDLVLTCKLHLGVVACMFNKSVLAVAVHPEKTRRFYSEIGETNRCVSLFDISSKEISEILNYYKNKNVDIPKNMIRKASITWSILNENL